MLDNTVHGYTRTGDVREPVNQALELRRNDRFLLRHGLHQKRPYYRQILERMWTALHTPALDQRDEYLVH